MWLALVSTLLSQQPLAAETEIERGRVLIRQLYEEQALEVLAPFLDDATLPPSLHARALVYAGIAQMNLGDDVKAKALFSRALETDIAAVLPEWVSRKVRTAFATETDRVLTAKQRAAVVAGPEAVATATTRARRHGWVGPTLVAAGLGAGALSALCFVRWSDDYRRARDEPVAVASERINTSARPWFVGGEVMVGLGVALLLAAAWWWLWPEG